MAIEAEAVYEDGVLKLTNPLRLENGTKVRLSILVPSNWVEEHYGLCGFKGTVEESDYLASDPEFEYPPLLEEP